MLPEFASNDLAFFAVSSSAVTETTVAGRFDASYVQSAIVVGNGQRISCDVEATSPLSWVSFQMYSSGSGSGSNITDTIELSNALDVPFFRARRPQFGGTTLSLDYYNGTTWVTVTSITPPNTSLIKFDIRYDSSTGALEMFQQGTQVASTSIPSPLPLKRLYLRPRGGDDIYYSEVMILKSDTRAKRLMSRRANGDGAVSAPTGSYTDVSAIPYTGLTSRALDTAGDAFTMTKPAFTLQAGLMIDKVIVNNLIMASGPNVTNAQHILRVGATDYNSTNVTPAPAGAFEPRYSEWSVNPATGAKFTEAEFNAMQFGLEAVA